MYGARCNKQWVYNPLYKRVCYLRDKGQSCGVPFPQDITRSKRKKGLRIIEPIKSLIFFLKERSIKNHQHQGVLSPLIAHNPFNIFHSYSYNQTILHIFRNIRHNPTNYYQTRYDSTPPLLVLSITIAKTSFQDLTLLCYQAKQKSH